MTGSAASCGVPGEGILSAAAAVASASAGRFIPSVMPAYGPDGREGDDAGADARSDSGADPEQEWRDDDHRHRAGGSEGDRAGAVGADDREWLPMPPSTAEPKGR